jgi:glycosyltransferase involved in cell wall biosynthesis
MGNFPRDIYLTISYISKVISVLGASEVNAQDNELPTVSVVLCTFNSAPYVGNCLKSISNSDFPKNKVETICIDDGSSDNTVEVLEKYPVNVIVNSNRAGSAHARNLGIRKATGDIVLFVDSDSEVDQEMLRRHALHYCDPCCYCVAGKIVQIGRPNLVSECWETMPWIRIQQLEDEMIEKGLAWAPSGNLSLRTSFIKEVLFDDKIKGHGEDVDLGWMIAKYGCRPLREKEAVVYHRRKTSLLQLIRNMFSRGKSEVTLGTKHTSRVINVAPSLVAVSAFLVIFTLISSLRDGRYLLVCPVFFFAYLCVDLVVYLAGYRTFGYYGYVGSTLNVRIATWPIFLFFRLSFEAGKAFEALRVGKPKLFFKRIRYTERARENAKISLHFFVLTFALILAFLTAISV